MKSWIEPFLIVIGICLISLAVFNIVNTQLTNKKCDFITELHRLQIEVDTARPGADDALTRLVAEYNIRLAVYKTHGDMKEVPYIETRLIP